MSLFVADATLVVKWFIPEVDSDAARRWLDSSHDYIAPDLLFPEVANVVWKKSQRGELTPQNARNLVKDFVSIPIETVPTRGLIVNAHALAAASTITVYDATYLTLALRLDTQVISADARFARKLPPGLAAHVRPVEDFLP